MATLWKLPKSERKLIDQQKLSLEKEIIQLNGEIDKLEPWLENIKRMKARAQDKLAAIENFYK